MEENKNKDHFKEALQKKLKDIPIHSEQEDLEIWDALKSEMQAPPVKKGMHIRMQWYAYAASIVFGLVLSVVIYFVLTQEPTQPIAQNVTKDSIKVLPKEQKEAPLVKETPEPNQAKDAAPIASTPKELKVLSTGIEEHQLLDGSVIATNRGASISYRSDFRTNRSLAMDGEAYFEVKSDKAFPFTVQFGGHRLEVVGTKFNVRALQGEAAEVSVTEGTVKVFPKNQGKGILVKKNEQLLVDENGVTLNTIDAQNYIGWKTGNLKFEDAKMEQVATLLSRQYQVQIKIDPAISACIFTGNLNQVSFENALKILEMTTSFKIKVKSNNVYYISGSGCD